MSAPGSGILARGPWHPDQVRVRWLEQAYEPPADLDRQADTAVDALRERGSPCHDGLSTRLASFAEVDGGLALELQPSRWALRLVDTDASDSLTALCVVRTDDGRWLAGRRAGWVSTWAGPLGARRRRSGGPGREPGRDAAARAARGVAAGGRTASASRRSCASPTAWRWSSGWPRWPTHRSRWPTTSTTSGRGGIPIPTAGPSTRTTACGRWDACWRRRARALDAGHADRAGDARAADPAVPVGVLREVLLVVVLGVVERPRGLDLGGDLAVAGALESLGVSVA